MTSGLHKQSMTLPLLIPSTLLSDSSIISLDSINRASLAGLWSSGEVRS